jgi:hypothetical protein
MRTDCSKPCQNEKATIISIFSDSQGLKLSKTYRTGSFWPVPTFIPLEQMEKSPFLMHFILSQYFKCISESESVIAKDLEKPQPKYQ